MMLIAYGFLAILAAWAAFTVLHAGVSTIVHDLAQDVLDAQAKGLADVPVAEPDQRPTDRCPPPDFDEDYSSGICEVPPVLRTPAMRDLVALAEYRKVAAK